MGRFLLVVACVLGLWFSSCMAAFCFPTHPPLGFLGVAQGYSRRQASSALLFVCLFPLLQF